MPVGREARSAGDSETEFHRLAAGRGFVLFGELRGWVARQHVGTPALQGGGETRREAVAERWVRVQAEVAAAEAAQGAAPAVEEERLAAEEAARGEETSVQTDSGEGAPGTADAVAAAAEGEEAELAVEAPAAAMELTVGATTAAELRAAFDRMVTVPTTWTILQ